MTKYTVDYDDYEEQEFYDGEQPKPGLYEFKLVDVDLDYVAAGSGAEGFKWTFRCEDEPYAGWFGYMYSNMDSTKQKTQRVLKAIRGGSTKKIVLDSNHPEKILKAAKPVMGRVKSDYYEEEYKPKLSFVMELDEVSKKRRSKRDDEDIEEEEYEEPEELEEEELEEEEEYEEEEPEAEEEEEEEEEPAPPPRRARKAAKKAPATKAAKRRREAF